MIGRASPMSADETSPSEESKQPGKQPDPPPRPRIVSSHELLQGSRELWIEHEGEMYRLRLTAGGKLYLTK